MFYDMGDFLSSDAFLSFVLLLILSMLGLRFFPFNLSDYKLDSIRSIWKGFSLRPTRRTQLERAISSFLCYERLSMLEIREMQNSYARISRAHKRIGYDLGYPAKLDQVAEAVRRNAVLTSTIAKSGLDDAGLDIDGLENATSNDLREVREAMRHFIRDWSAEGREERNVIIKPILEVVEKVPPRRREKVKVLVPGSGLGRLAWEINQIGFTTYANELSPFMNTCFGFLISPDHTHRLFQHTVHPYAHWFSHQRSNASLFRYVSFPDALPRLSTSFRHLPCDFLRLTSEPGRSGSYDYVVTQFFIDTSYNIISTLEKIHQLLKPAGTWINLGPLLWRSGAQAALELSLDEVLSLAEKVGFSVDEGSRRTIDCEYTADKEAMMRWIYQAEFWVAVKR